MVGGGTALSGRDGQATNSTNQETHGAVNAKSVGGLTRIVPLPRGIPTVDTSTSDLAVGRWCCEQLELGNILFSPAIPFDFPEGWRTFLLQQRLPESRYHKNIAYRPGEDRLTGLSSQSKETRERLRSILRNYSRRVAEYLSRILPEYARNWRRDYTSFRPFEDQGRHLSLRARNDLLHTDAFPTRPTNGARILRFFTNLNREQPRVWLTGPTFETLSEQYASQVGPPVCRAGRAEALQWAARQARQIAKALRLPVMMPSRYDEFMLRFHHFLKENRRFQQSCPKELHEFPPDSCWMVFTDMVSHAVLSGQFALEQTFLVPRSALVLPDNSPLCVLERLCGLNLVAS